MSFVSKNQIMEELIMNQKLSTKVTGGQLTAKASEDPNYPGIVISFEPDHGGGSTELALLEECDGKLVLRSWMNLSKEEPDSIRCQYDAVLLSQVAYGYYLKECNDLQKCSVSMQEFAETIFYKESQMRFLLPDNLFQEYKNIIMAQEDLDNAGK